MDLHKVIAGLRTIEQMSDLKAVTASLRAIIDSYEDELADMAIEQNEALREAMES